MNDTGNTPQRTIIDTVVRESMTVRDRLLAIHGEQQRRIVTLLCVLGVAIFGVWLTVSSLAETFLASAEAESGVIEGAAQIQDDAEASGGSAVRFGDTLQDNPDNPQ